MRNFARVSKSFYHVPGEVLPLRAPTRKLDGRIRLPGSKSLANRALVLAAQLPGVEIQGLPDADDVRVVQAYIEALLAPGPVSAHLGLAGTAARFVTAHAALQAREVRLEGAPRLRERALRPLLECLQRAGVRFLFHEKPGQLPFTILPNTNTWPKKLTLDSRQSSQLLSALLLVGPSLKVGTEIHLEPPELPSRPYAEMTHALCEKFGVAWEETAPFCYRLTATSAARPRFEIEGDWSAASYYLGLAALRPSDLLLHPLHPDSLQGDRAQLALWEPFGVEASFENSGLRVRSAPQKPARFNADLAAMPDLAQTFAVVCAAAGVPALLTGLHTLPGKETDRLAALKTELGALGCTVETTASALELVPGPLRQTRPVRTYHDHRMAMSFALLSTVLPKVEIEAPAVVGKSYPGFWEALQSLGFSAQTGTF